MKRQFLPIVRAGLTQGEMANLVGVSRVTINNWMTDRREVHVLLKPRVAKILDAIDSAMLAGALPLEEDVLRTDRITQIRRIVAKHLSKTIT